MEDFVERVKVEKQELDLKLEKLNGFLNSPLVDKLDRESKSLLKVQAATMKVYSDVLEARLEVLLEVK